MTMMMTMVMRTHLGTSFTFFSFFTLLPWRAPVQPWQTVGMADKATKLLSFVFLTYVGFSFLKGIVGRGSVGVVLVQWCRIDT